MANLGDRDFFFFSLLAGELGLFNHFSYGEILTSSQLRTTSIRWIPGQNIGKNIGNQTLLNSRDCDMHIH